jgi:hypothetical protein
MYSEKKQILITVKAYPNPSTKYEETVCCAEVDLSNYQLIRLYPIPFRDLDYSKQFKKYTIIEVACDKSKDDHRQESFHIDFNTIKVIKEINTKNNWDERKSIVLKLSVKSMCQVNRDVENKFSLGLIKPYNISFDYKKQNCLDQEEREACYSQLSFFDKAKDAIEKIPYVFYYMFYCQNEPDCPGHKLSIIDWEIVQAYRKWRAESLIETDALQKIKQKWLDMANVEKKDVYFYVGNMKRFPKQFMVLGVFYPPII